jgi:hypothetical protein
MVLGFKWPRELSALAIARGYEQLSGRILPCEWAAFTVVGVGYCRLTSCWKACGRFFQPRLLGKNDI